MDRCKNCGNKEWTNLIHVSRFDCKKPTTRCDKCLESEDTYCDCGCGSKWGFKHSEKLRKSVTGYVDIDAQIEARFNKNKS